MRGEVSRYLIKGGGRKRIVGDKIAGVKRAQNLHLRVKGQGAEKLPEGNLIPQLHPVSPAMMIHCIAVVDPTKNAGVGKTNANQSCLLLRNWDISVIVAVVLPRVGKAESMRGGPTGHSNGRRGGEKSRVKVEVKTSVGRREICIGQGEKEKRENRCPEPRLVLSPAAGPVLSPAAGAIPDNQEKKPGQAKKQSSLAAPLQMDQGPGVKGKRKALCLQPGKKPDHEVWVQGKEQAEKEEAEKQRDKP
jgi:hypothetical protein